MSEIPFVHVHRWRFWASPLGRQDSDITWRKGLTVWDIAPEDAMATPGFTVHVNGVRVEPGMEAVYDLMPGDHVDLSVRPADPALLPLAIVSSLVASGVSYVISLILPKPKGPKRRGDEESSTYAWTGKDNERVEGQPRRLVYGELRIAPQVIDEFVRTTTVPPRSTLYALLALSEGPIEAVGDVTIDTPLTTVLSTEDPANPLPSLVEINSNPVANFNHVEGWVRLGTNEQEAIPGFEEIHTVSEVGSTLNQAETDAETNAGTAWSLATEPFNSNVSSVQAIWDQYAQTFDLPSEADAYRILVNFPEGLYLIDNSGNLQDAYFRALVRYRQLDGGGNPITTGGDNGDGWIYEKPKNRLAAKQQAPFQYEIAGSFVSPSGYTAGQQGRILDCTSSGAFARTAASSGGAAVDAVTPWAQGTDIPEFSFETWYKPTSLPSTTGVGITVRPIFEWLSSTPRGFSLNIVGSDEDVGENGPEKRWHLRVYWGDGTALRNFEDVGPSHYNATHNIGGVRWYHFAVTYKRNASGVSDRWRIYIDGNLVREYLVSGQDMEAAASPFKFMRTTDTGLSALDGQGRMDETRVWQTERTAAEIAASYADGIGNFGSALAPGLVCGWHFDVQDNITNFTYAASYGPHSNPVTTAGTPQGVVGEASTQLDAIVFRPGTGTPQRARFRVQVMRFNLKSTSTRIGDRSDWQTIDGRLDEQLAYPNTALLGLKVRATDQLSGSSPRYTCVVKGIKVPVWDGINAESPSVTYRWSANPAWICLDILTNRRYGRGGDYDFKDVDLVSFKEWADYCDELLYDGLGRTSIHESDAAVPIQHLKYDSTLFSGFGGIELWFRLGFTPPASWKVGGHLGFAGLPVPPTTGIAVDVTTANIRGFEIGEIQNSLGVYKVKVKYDKALYGDPWSDGALLADVILSTVSGTVEGREVRFRWDGALDTFAKVWDVLLQIAGTARATPILDGHRIRMRVSKPRAPVGFVGMGSIEPKSFKVSYSSRTERPNAYVADFLDRDRNWERTTAERLDSTLSIAAPEGAFNREHLDLQGIVRRSQALRDLDFRLNVNELLTRQGEFTTGIEGILYEPGDVVVLAHDLVPWGKAGRLTAAPSGTSMTFDRSITLAPSTTYYVRVRVNAQGQTGQGSSVADYMEVRQITSAAGTYAAGATVTILSAFTVTPAKDDPYLVYSTAEQFLAEIAETTLTPDWKRRVRWIQYRDDTYDVDLLPQDLPQELVFGGSTPPGPKRAPAPVSALEVREATRRSGAGTWNPELSASWVLDATTAPWVSEVLVHARVAGSESPWELVAQASGPATSARFRPPSDTPGATIEVAVQPVSERGMRVEAELCRRASVTLSGFYVPPPAPTNLTAVMDGDQVTYRWTPPANARGLVTELRRGGWILGQTIGIAPAGASSLGPTRNWSAGKTNVIGDGYPRIYARCRDERGQWSEAAVLEGFNPAPAGAVVLTPPNIVGKRVNGDTCWEDYGADWFLGGGDPPSSGVEAVQDESGRWILQLSSGNDSGYYESVVGAIDADSKPEHVYLEAYAVAHQVPPLTAEQWTIGADSPLAARRTMEGTLGAAGCTLSIEFCYKPTKSTDSYTAWQKFQPGRYFLLAPKFRLVLTRPDSTWNMRIERFGTRISRIPPQKFQKAPVAQLLEASAIALG